MVRHPLPPTLRSYTLWKMRQACIPRTRETHSYVLAVNFITKKVTLFIFEFYATVSRVLNFCALLRFESRCTRRLANVLLDEFRKSKNKIGVITAADTTYNYNNNYEQTVAILKW